MRLRPRPWIYWDETPVWKFFPQVAPERDDIVLIHDERMRIVRVDLERRRIKVKPA